MRPPGDRGGRPVSAASGGPSGALPRVVMNRGAIEAAIPHRAPFLFLDAVVERAPGALTATWRVPEDAPWFAGHFPGQPVLPGVLISEHVFQAAAVLIALEAGGLPADAVPVLTKIEAARFRRVVRPGESLATTVQIEERLGPAWYVAGAVTCAGAPVLKLRCTLSAVSPGPRREEGA